MSALLAMIGPFAWHVHGYIYAFVGLMLLATVVTFALLWRRGQLDMDEGPKFQMFQADKDERQEGGTHG